MRYRTTLALIILLVATMACSLSAVQPTAVPTEIVVDIETEEPPATDTPRPTATPTVTPGSTSNNTPCTPRADWAIMYTVVPGDTLGSIASRTNSSVNALAAGNCLANPNSISVGLRLRVPQVPTAPLPPTVTRTPTVTATVVSPPPAPMGFVSISSFISGDAGNYYLLQYDNVMLTWDGAPANLYRATFFPVDPGQNYVNIGEDNNPADGISINWNVPAGLRGHNLIASGRFFEGNVIIPSGPSLVGSAPKADEGCYMSAANPEGVTIYMHSGPDAPVYGTLTQEMSVQILGQALNGWYGFDPGGISGESGIARLRWVPVGSLLEFSAGCIG
jgi:hypothetical protein